MEKSITEKDTVSTVPSRVQVLKIGDEDDGLTEKKGSSKFLRDSLADFRSHLGYLLLGTRRSIEFVDDSKLIQRFEMSIHEPADKPVSYFFHYGMGIYFKPRTIWTGSTVCGRVVMDEVKKELKEEKWISENEITSPLKAKLDNFLDNRDRFVEKVASDALDAEKKRLVNYILFLHRQYVRDK